MSLLGKLAGSEIYGFVRELAGPLAKKIAGPLSKKLQVSESETAQILGEIIETKEIKEEFEQITKNHINRLKVAEGEFGDLTAFGKDVRALVRPYIAVSYSTTYLIAVIACLINTELAESVREVIAIFKLDYLNGAIVGFYFFDRGLQHWLGRIKK